MKKLRQTLAAAAVSMLGLVAAPAQADVIELALVLDGSGSIGTTNWNLQVQAYQNIFNDNFVTNFVNPADELYVSVFRFSSSVTHELGQTHISSDAVAGAFGNQIATIAYTGGSTNTAAATTAATNHLLSGATVAGDKMIIDVSTDGQPFGTPNAVGDALAAASAAAAQGVTVNAIGVGNGISASFLSSYTTNGGGFFMTASNFNEFEASLRRKLFREIQGVPDASVIGMMLSGLFMVGFARRRNS